MFSTSFSNRLVFRRTLQIETFDLTADQWDAYTGTPGVEDAAKRINTVILEAVNAGNDRAGVTKRAHVAMTLEREFGFDDTEPHQVLGRVLDMLFGRHTR